MQMSAFRRAYAQTPDAVPRWVHEHLRRAYPEGDLVPRFLGERGIPPAAAILTLSSESLWLQRSHRMLARHSRVLYVPWSVACSFLAPMLSRPLPRGEAYRSVTVLRLA